MAVLVVYLRFDAQGNEACSKALQEIDSGVMLGDCTGPAEQGRKSYVLFLPNDEVLKVQRPGQKENWMAREISNMQRFDALGIKSADYPKLQVAAEDNSWLLMSRMGNSLVEQWTASGHAPSDREAQVLGKQVGGFVAEMYQKSGGSIHKDLHFQNMTGQPGGRIGVIDFDDYGPGDPHEAFIKLMSQKPNIVPAATAAFTEGTGIKIDPQKVADLCIATLKKNGAPETAFETVRENLSEWKKDGSQPALRGKAPSVKP